MSEEKWWIEGGEEAKFDEPVNNPTNFLRFWMPEKTERKIIFLTDVVKLIIYEHNMRLNGHWRNWCTCLKMLKIPCPLCEAKNVSRYQVAPYSVIDLEEFTDKKGVKHANQRRLLMAKSVTYEKLMRQHKKRQEKGQSLVGAVYTVARLSGKKSCGCGDEFEFEEMVDLKDLQAEKIETAEFDYFKLLKPDKALAEKYASQSQVGVLDEGAGDDTPF